MSDPISGNAAIPLAVNVTPPSKLFTDPMSSAQSVAHTQNLLLQNALQQQEFAARKAMGSILLDSIDRNTGEINPDKALAAMAANPFTAYKAAEFSKALIEQQKAKQELQRQVLEQAKIRQELVVGEMTRAHKQLEQATNIMLPLMEKGDSITVADMQGAIFQGLELGLYGDPNSKQSKDAAIRMLNAVMPNASAQQLQDMLRRNYATVANEQSRLQAFIGKFTRVPAGGSEVIIREPGTMTGTAPKAVGQIPLTATPAQQAEYVEQWNPQTQSMQKVSKGALGIPPGQLVAGVPVIGAPPPQAQGAPLQMPTPQNMMGRAMPAGTPAAMAVLPQAPAAVVKANETKAEALAKATTDLSNNADKSRQAKLSLTNMQEALNKTFETGGPTANWKVFVANNWNANVPESMKIDVDKVGNFEEFSKLAFHAAVQSYGGPPRGLDAVQELKMLLGSNPGPEMSKKGNLLIMALMQGTADEVIAKNKAWVNSGRSPHEYDKWLADYNEKVDPRIFQWQYLDTDTKKFAMGNMTPATRKKLAASIQYASDKGLLETPEE